MHPSLVPLLKSLAKLYEHHFPAKRGLPKAIQMLERCCRILASLLEQYAQMYPSHHNLALLPQAHGGAQLVKPARWGRGSSGRSSGGTNTTNTHELSISNGHTAPMSQPGSVPESPPSLSAPRFHAYRRNSIMSSDVTSRDSSTDMVRPPPPRLVRLG